MIRIGVDAMGGDYAPHNVVLGALEARERLSKDVQLYLIGDRNKIAETCQQNGIDLGNFVIVHSTQIIKMEEHPVKAFMKKPDSSIAVGYKMLAEGELDAFASAGNTGAMLTGAVSILKVISGVLRPCISAEIPIISGGTMLLLDVGFNSDCKADILYQFAKMGNSYAKRMMGIPNPKVALLNIGEEQEKGNMVNKEAFMIMSDSADFNFVGNLEPTTMFRGGVADVVVTDGFVGNICLKQAEGMYNIVSELGIKNEYLDRFNYELYGGTQVLGIHAPVIIGHGASSSKAICNMILKAEKSIKNGLIENILSIFADPNKAS